MFVIDDVLLAVPALVTIWRAWDKVMSAPVAQVLDVAACRAAVPVEPGLKWTKSLLGGYMYSGNDPGHIEYLHDYLDQQADSVSGEDRRRILAFKALQGREGSTAAINSYDNQLVTIGTGWGGLGGLGRVMDRLVSDPAAAYALAVCGVWYRGSGEWTVVDDQGRVITDRRQALTFMSRTPAILNRFIEIARDPTTRDAMTSAQLDAFMTSSGQIPGSETIASQALFNFATHLKHWAPGYMQGVVEGAAQRTPGSPSVERDKVLAREIVRGFYGRAHGWVPDWNQMQRYALRDMREDGLDVGTDPVLTATSAPHEPVKTIAGCGSNWASFKSIGGPGVPPGFEHAREVREGWGEVQDDTSYRHVQGPGSATPEQVATVRRGVQEAVRAGENDPSGWTQITVGPYALMVMNEPIAVRGLRLPTSFDDAVAISRMIGAVPITKVIADARWAHAKRVHAQPLTDATGALHDDPDQVVRYNARMGSNTGEFRDGFWKELVLTPDLARSGRGSMAQYGFRDTDSHQFEHGGPSNHFRQYKDYAITPTYVSRAALKDGVQVDLLDEYAAGGLLTPALPEWLVAQFRQEVA